MAKIAFIGLGNMGSGMCANMCKAGMDISAYDLSSVARDAAAAAGAQVADSAEAAAQGAEMVITMLPAGSHVLDVYFDTGRVARAAVPGALLIDCSTIAVEDARQAHRMAREAGFAMLDAPVSGGVAAAQAGTLTFMVGGEAVDFARAEPVLATMGANVFHAGGAGNGQAAKIANNMLLGVSMIATCEAFNLAEKLGLDAQTFFDISSKASGQCWSMTSYCPAPGPVPAAPSNRDYQPGFSVAMMLKDLKLAMGAAEGTDAAAEFGKAAEQAYQALADEGHSARDCSVPLLKLKGGL